MKEGTIGKATNGIIDRLFGIRRFEGELTELVESYSGLLAKAKNSAHLAFPHLPPEIFSNKKVLAELERLTTKGGRVEVVTLRRGLDYNQIIFSELQATGAVLYLCDREQSFSSFTILDERDLIFHLPYKLSQTRWEQIYMPNAMIIGNLISDYRRLRGVSTQFNGKR